MAHRRLDEDSKRVGELRSRLEAELISKGRGAVQRNGSEENRIPSTTSLSFEGISGEDLLIALDLAGIAVSAGAACAAGSPEPSHVLLAMGLTREE